MPLLPVECAGPHDFCVARRLQRRLRGCFRAPTAEARGVWDVAAPVMPVGAAFMRGDAAAAFIGGHLLMGPLMGHRVTEWGPRRRRGVGVAPPEAHVRTAHCAVVPAFYPP